MASQQPNVILFTWHDAGRWFGSYGFDTVHTPAVDRMAAEGVRFANCFSACAICSPSRAAIATGMYCQRNGVMTLANGPFDNRIHPHVPHVSARLHERGYRTALFGVAHEAAHEHVETVLQLDERFATDPWPRADITAGYVRPWLEARAAGDRPFFAQIGTYEAHLNRFYSGAPARPDEAYPPVQDESKGLFVPPYLVGSDADKQTVATLQGLLRRGDGLLGTVLDTLDKTGQSANTLVIMCVDHGVGLSRAKATCYDPGTAVAWQMRWPGVLPAGGVVDALCGHVDVLPTVWELLGLDVPPGLDGLSFAGHARGATTDELRDAVYSHMVENTRSVRTNRWKLIRNFRPPRYVGRQADCGDQHKKLGGHGGLLVSAPGAVPAGPQPHVELYDLQADPHEMHNLADDPQHAATRDQMDDRLWGFLFETDDFLVHDTVRTAWQQQTRADLMQFCTRQGRTAPRAEGPLGDPRDEATARGRVFGG